MCRSLIQPQNNNNLKKKGKSTFFFPCSPERLKAFRRQQPVDFSNLFKGDKNSLHVRTTTTTHAHTGKCHALQSNDLPALTATVAPQLSVMNCFPRSLKNVPPHS